MLGSEATHFTPWLAANPSVPGAALGIEGLELVSTEAGIAGKRPDRGQPRPRTEGDRGDRRQGALPQPDHFIFTTTEKGRDKPGHQFSSGSRYDIPLDPDYPACRSAATGNAA